MGRLSSFLFSYSYHSHVVAREPRRRLMMLPDRLSIGARVRPSTGRCRSMVARPDGRTDGRDPSEEASERPSRKTTPSCTSPPIRIWLLPTTTGFEPRSSRDRA